MNQQILSQDEVDALLQGITADEESPEPEAAAAGGVRSVDFSAAERVVRGRMPALEIVNERFARNIRGGLFEVMRRPAEVSVGSVRVHKFSAFCARSWCRPTSTWWASSRCAAPGWWCATRAWCSR
jgi:flagellar motor switch protein FliM